MYYNIHDIVDFQSSSTRTAKTVVVHNKSSFYTFNGLSKIKNNSRKTKNGLHAQLDIFVFIMGLPSDCPCSRYIVQKKKKHKKTSSAVEYYCCSACSVTSIQSVDDNVYKMLWTFCEFKKSHEKNNENSEAWNKILNNRRHDFILFHTWW